MPAAFVSFKTRWAAAVCAQTQQTSNPTIWLTEWAPEPRDVYWSNLAIPFVKLSIRRFIMAVALFFLIFFFIIPITIVQSLASIEGIEKAAPFLKPLIEVWVLLFLEWYRSMNTLKTFEFIFIFSFTFYNKFLGFGYHSFRMIRLWHIMLIVLFFLFMCSIIQLFYIIKYIIKICYKKSIYIP